MDILNEIDGLMLQHEVQGFHSVQLVVPARAALRPDRDFLEQRYIRFKNAS